MNKWIKIAGLNLCLWSISCFSQQKIQLTLDDAINQWVSSNEYTQLKEDSIICTLSHHIFNASILPQITLSATLPNFNRSISLITQPDGSGKYVAQSYANMAIGVNISQLLPFTGGKIMVSSNLDRQDNFNIDKHAYYFNLINLSYSQNLFNFNEYKWKQKQEEIQKTKEHIHFLQTKESIKQNIIKLFFNLLIEQRNTDLHKENLKLSKYIYEKAQKLYQQNRISKEDLIDAHIEYTRKLNNIDSINLENAQEELRIYLNLPTTLIPYVIFDDKDIPVSHLKFDKKNIIANAIKYNYTIDKNISILDKNIEIKKLKQNTQPTIFLSIGSGYNSQFETFSHLLEDKISKTSASLTLSLPIYDGKINKHKSNIAKIELKQIGIQYKNDTIKAIAKYNKELQTIDYLINSIKNNKQTLELIKQRLNIIKINVKMGKLDMQKILQAQVQLLETFISYNAQIQELYSLIYKYRFLSLIDIRNNQDII